VDKLEETLGFVSSYWPGYSKIPVCRLARSDMETMRADLKKGISKRTGDHLKAATVGTLQAHRIPVSPGQKDCDV
jgi:hypothetical protein